MNQARTRAAIRRRRLPPGDLQNLDVLEKSNRAVLIHEAAQHGPVFKVEAYGRFWVCVVGLDVARRFIKSVGESIRPVTMDLEPLVPGGFMRQMTGDFHRKYRQRLGRALSQTDLAGQVGVLEAITRQHLATYAESQMPGAMRTKLSDSLHAMTTDLLLHILFGAEPGTDYHGRLILGYAEMGSDGLAWTIGDPQTRGFSTVAETVRDRCEELASTAQTDFGGLAFQAFGDGGLDDTMLGNLIYMVEMGRDDTTVLFRWLTKYATEQAEYFSNLASCVEDPSFKTRARAFVSETLRTDQSYRLLRITTSNVMFDGYFIPKGSMVRICMWESHRAPEVFDRPFEFDANRFVAESYGASEFTPFGIDQHQCPFAAVSVLMGEAFLRSLADTYVLSPLGESQAVRGPYHWEPAPGFEICLNRRDH